MARNRLGDDFYQSGRRSRVVATPQGRDGHRVAAGVLLALGTWTFGLVLPNAAQAQCSTGPTPTPPPPLRSDFSNQSFGNTPPLKPYRLNTSGG